MRKHISSSSKKNTLYINSTTFAIVEIFKDLVVQQSCVSFDMFRFYFTFSSRLLSHDVCFISSSSHFSPQTDIKISARLSFTLSLVLTSLISLEAVYISKYYGLIDNHILVQDNRVII